MSIKEKVAAFLLGLKQAKEPAREQEPSLEYPEPDPPKTVVGKGFSAPVIEIAEGHPIGLLYELYRQEGNSLPALRLCLDEDGALPQEAVQRESGRIPTFLSTVCGKRLKEANGKAPKKASKGQPGEGQEDAPPPLDALPRFFLSADKLYAWVLVLPPVRGGAPLSREMLSRAMEQEGIVYGIETQTVDRLPHDGRRYFHLFLIARGKPAFDGKNGNIIEHFPREVERILKADEFNQVDYTALNLIHNVKQGEEICRLILPTEGEPGRTVLDQEIPAKGGQAVPLPKGQNTEISEDGASLIASIAGHVEYSGRGFQVKPVMDIPGNVDFSTGDINFLGDVNIAGDVLSGFTVWAMGNVHVDGVLEAGSAVEAGGDLVVVKGIWGDGTTVIRSHRSVFSKYIENSTIHVQENLQADCIVNGNVYCDGEVQVNTGRGVIMGGRIWAAKRILAKTVGSPAECRNLIELSGKPCTHFERALLRKEVKELSAELEKLESQPESQVKTSLLQKIQARISVAELKLKHLENELAQEKGVLDDPDGGRLECGVAYPGTEIVFEREVVRLRNESRQFVATVVNGEIVLM